MTGGWSAWQEWDVVANDDLGNRNGWAFSCWVWFCGLFSLRSRLSGKNGEC